MNPFSKVPSILSLALSGMVFTSVACNDMQGDQRKADLKVRDSVKSSAQHRQNPKEWDSAVADLNAAAGQTAASPSHKIRANALLAEAEFEAGDRFARDLNNVDPNIASALWDISQIASHIQSVNDTIKALTATNPADMLKAIETNHATAAAASTAAAAKAAELQTQIQAVKTEIEGLIRQKDAAIAEADATAEKASKATLKEAEPMLDAVTESRRKAGNFGHAIDKTSAKLFPLEADLAAENARKKSANEAVAALDASKKTTDTNWATVQAQIQAQKTLAGTLGEQLAAKAKALDDLNKQAASLRAKALEQYDKSARHNAAASTDAKALATVVDAWTKNEKFTEAPEFKAWKQMQQLYNLDVAARQGNSPVFRIFEAEADNAQANLHSTAAAQIAAQQKLAAGISKTLQDAGITMPATLAASAEDQKKEQDAASKKYTEAETKFDGAAKAVGIYPKELKEAAQISRMFSLYSQYLNGDTTKLAPAKEIFKEVLSPRKDEPAIQALPAELRG